MNSVVDIQNGQGDHHRGGPRWWSWLRGALLPQDRGVESQCGHRDPDEAAATAPPLAPTAFCQGRDSGSAAAPLEGNGSPVGSGIILPFPIHGEALLVKLAEALRSRVADRGDQWDPLLLQMSRCPRSRLSIDRRAYIEFHQDCSEYRAVIEASQGTKVILETADFDALVDFVLQYVGGGMAEPAALEVAS